MPDRHDDTDSFQPMLDRLAAGDPGAADELIEHSQRRLHRLARKMLGQRPAVHRWEQTDDVLQNALLRLRRAVKKVKPATGRHFLNLAAQQVRRELIDLARRHHGPEGLGANHATDPGAVDPKGDAVPLHEAQPDGRTGPEAILQLAEFHEQVQNLPEEEREVFDLVFYQGLSQEQTATQIGVSVPTVKRRWRSAKLLLHEATKSDADDDGD